jgi:hypothetical protein
MVKLFDNNFETSFEDMMTATAILDDCVDKEKRDEFFKSVLPHTVLEQKFEKLVEVNKGKADPKPELKKSLADTFNEKFEAASK